MKARNSLFCYLLKRRKPRFKWIVRCKVLAIKAVQCTFSSRRTVVFVIRYLEEFRTGVNIYNGLVDGLGILLNLIDDALHPGNRVKGF